MGHHIVCWRSSSVPSSATPWSVLHIPFLRNFISRSSVILVSCSCGLHILENSKWRHQMRYVDILSLSYMKMFKLLVLSKCAGQSMRMSFKKPVHKNKHSQTPSDVGSGHEATLPSGSGACVPIRVSFKASRENCKHRGSLEIIPHVIHSLGWKNCVCEVLW